MKITTLRFGELEIPDDKIIQMAKPVLGFEQLKKFCIIEGEDCRRKNGRNLCNCLYSGRSEKNEH